VAQAHAKHATNSLLLWIKGVPQPDDASSEVQLTPPTAAARAAMSVFFSAAAADVHAAVHGAPCTDALDERSPQDHTNGEMAHSVMGVAGGMMPPPALSAGDEASIGLGPLFELLLDACASEAASEQPLLPLPDVD
jgi:hypothetical protein